MFTLVDLIYIADDYNKCLNVEQGFDRSEFCYRRFIVQPTFVNKLIKNKINCYELLTFLCFNITSYQFRAYEQ